MVASLCFGNPTPTPTHTPDKGDGRGQDFIRDFRFNLSSCLVDMVCFFFSLLEDTLTM